MKFREFIQPQAIVPALQASDRDGVIRELVTALRDAGAVNPEAVDAIVNALIAREQSGTTGFGKGVAAPHCKHPLVERVVGTVGLSAKGVDFRGLDGKPAHAFFLLLSPALNHNQHVQAMETVFLSLNKEIFRKFLRQADSREKVMELLDEADGK